MRAIISSLIVGLSLAACTSREGGHDAATPQNMNDMKNLVSIIEIPTVDFSRAMDFYQKAFNIDIEVVEMEGIKIGLFPQAGAGPVVQLIHGDGYKPAAAGTLIYLNGDDDLQKTADRVDAHGGKVILPKTEIGPDMGFYALFTDTEGNKLGLHSLH